MHSFHAYEQLLKRKPAAELPAFHASWTNQSPKRIVLLKKSNPSKLLWLAAASLFIAGIVSFTTWPFVFSSRSYAGIEELDPENYTTAVATILSVNGVASIVRSDGSSRPVFSGDSVQIPVELVTSSGSVDLLLPDQSRLRLLADTRLRFDSMGPQTVLYQSSGTTLHSVSPKPNSSATTSGYRVITDHGSIVVKGTRFSVQQTEHALRVLVEEGTVTAVDPGYDTGLNLINGQSGEVSPGKAILLPEFEGRDELLQEIATLHSADSSSLELLREISKLTEVKAEADFEKIYSRPPETIILRDGRELIGVVASQAGGQLVLHTTGGIIAVARENVIEIRYDR